MFYPSPNNPKTVYLSHPLNINQPVYGGAKGTMEISSLKAIGRGDSCHTFRVAFENHAGTHVDAPAHFFENAPAVVDYPAGFWIFENPQVLEFSVRPAQLLDVGVFEGKVRSSADLLILKTGFQSFRGKEEYACRNPGIAASVGFWLREHFPDLRAVGFDFISLSSYQNRPEGRLAHKAFLDPRGQGHPVVIIEDMDLQKDLSGIQRVIVAPLLVDGIDSAPCTVLGISK